MKFIKLLGINIILILLVLFGIVTAISFLLKSYTRHGQALQVPDVRGLKYEDAARVLDDKKLRYVIADSVFFEDKPKQSVLEQNPAAGSSVKENRTIYLTVNTSRAPKVSMPNVLDVSLRQAEPLLKSAGFKIGKYIYKPDIAKDVVLDVLVYNQSIQPGQKIEKGTTIDLVLGDGLNGESVDMPDLVGLSLQEAHNLLKSSSLNLGSVVYVGAVSDSSAATVVRQNPPYTEGANIKAGQTIDLFLKQ